MTEAIELATAYVSITGATDKLARSIKDAIRGGQLYADRNPINIKAAVDVSHIGSVEIPVTADTSRFDTQVHDAIRDAQAYADAHPISIRANVDVSHVGNVNVDVVPDFSLFADRMAVGLALLQAQHQWNVGVGVQINSAAALAAMAALHAQLQGMASPIQQNVNVDVDRSGLDRLRSVGSLGDLTKAAGATAAAGAGIAAIGGAAGAALGAVGALGVGITALGPAAAAAAATVAVGVQGIGDAFKALSAAEDSAGADGQAQAKAVAAAQEQVVTALENVETAQQNLSDAQKDARDATDDIAKAYKEAADELEDYQLKVRDASLSEKEAALALKEAQKDLAKAKPEDREKALLRVERAELRLAEAQEKNRDTQEAAADAQAKGIEGSDKVVAAKDKAAQADQRVADAQKAVQKAYDQVAKAQKAVADASSSSSSAQDKAAQALAKLSPNAQAFVLAARDVKSSWDDLVATPTQDALFAGADAGIKDLAAVSLPTLGVGMTAVATSINALTKDFAQFWKAPENLAGIQSIFAGTASFIDGMGPGLKQATTGFLSIGKAFEPVAEKIGGQVAGLFGNIGQAFTDAFESGALTKLFDTFGNIIEGLGGGLKAVVDGLIDIGNTVGPSLGPLFLTLGEAFKALAPSLGSIGKVFADTFTKLIPPLTVFIDALLRGLEPVLPVIGKLLESLMGALTPLIGPMSQIAVTIGEALVKAIDALAPSIGPIGTAFAALITAVAPLLPVFAELVSNILQALAPALTTIFNALGPVVQQFADAFLPVIKDMAPVLADVAKTLGQAIAQAITDLAPILPPLIKAWGDLLLSVTPILPEFAKLAAEILPPLTQLLIEMSPVIIDMMKAFTALINDVIIPIVIPVMEQFGGTVKTAIETAVSAVSAAKDFLKGAMEDIGGFFSDAADFIGKAWGGVVHGIAVGVKALGDLIQKIPTKIAGISIPGADDINNFGKSLSDWGTAHLAVGGLLRGPGTGTSDSIIAAVSNGEFVVNAAATSKTLPLLQAINAGWVPSADFLHGMIPGFATGGRVPGKAFAESMDSAGYLMGGFSRTSIDCSGMVAATVNDALGLDPFGAGRMSTQTEGSWLKSKGALPGLGGPGDMAIAWYDNGGGANGHTAMRLSDGTGVESRSGDGVVIGTGATPVTSSMFDHQMHIPAAALLGGDLGGPAGGNTSGGSGLGGGLSGGTGTGGSTGGSGGGNGGAANTSGATPVFVVNWPTGVNVAASTPGVVPTSPDTLSSTEFGSTTPTTSSPMSADQSTHPLANLPIPGAKELFNGPAPWYMAATPEQAVANLGAQANTLAQRTTSDVQNFFQNNWREMLETGAGVLGMGAFAGGGGHQMTVINNGMDPNSAAAAVERVWRRRTLATQRSGGFTR
ncbi:hypothetical protein [Nocardia anaemiae]|uniref:hypothetical protein n=1 Tax=Nocardia anaemiae TaxID=263910 RepID=UPI0007A50EF8|nr:hypothetical protein [Nocardia anaemiae]